MTPCTAASPMTWPTMRRLRQPIALRVPNSRTRRVTEAMVSSTASTKAASSTSAESQVPSVLARVEAVLSEPETLLARSEAVVTVADGSSFSISDWTVEIADESVAVT